VWDDAGSLVEYGGVLVTFLLLLSLFVVPALMAVLLWVRYDDKNRLRLECGHRFHDQTVYTRRVRDLFLRRLWWTCMDCGKLMPVPGKHERKRGRHAK
jgi:hypothetical protein